MSLSSVFNDAEERMMKVIEVYTSELRGIRTGRASSALVENIKVDYYGVPTPLKQIANVAVPEARLIVIKTFDPGALPAIEKAIVTSDIGITPNNDGKLIRLSIPPLTEERRKMLAVVVKDSAEKAKTAIRNIRRDSNKTIEQLEKDKIIPEDDKFNGLEKIQKLTNEYEKEVEETLKKKQKEVMEV